MEQRNAQRLFTYEEYVKYAENQRCEWIDGVIYDMSGTNVNHKRIVKRLARALENYLEGKPCEMFDETMEVRFPKAVGTKAVVVPDLMVVCDPDQIQYDAIIGAPVFIVEVLSPSTSLHDNVTKRGLYALNGVKEYWIVSPPERAVSVNILRGEVYKETLVETGVVASACFPDFSVDLATLFENMQ